VAIEYRLFTNGAAGVQVTGTFTATLELQTTIDGTNYVAVQGLKVSDGTDAPTITAVGIYRYELVGSKGCRVKATAYTSGTAVVTLAAMEG
jgi:hypothetical protein